MYYEQGCLKIHLTVFACVLLTGASQARKTRSCCRRRFGSFLGALLVAQIGYVYSLWLLVGICAIFLPVGFFGMDRCVRA